MARPESRIRRQVAFQGALAALVCWVAVAAMAATGVTESVDLKLLDLRFRLRGKTPVSESLVIVGVDDATIAAYRTWPLSRDAYALLLTAIMEGGARAAGVDFLFPSENTQDPDSDALLAYVTARYDGIVQAIGFHSGPGDSLAGNSRADVDEEIRSHGLAAPDLRAAEAAVMTSPYPELLQAAGALGHTNIAIDRDGAIRRLPLFIRHGTRIYPALSLRLAGMAGGERSLPSVRAAGRETEVVWADRRHLRLPVDDEGLTAINYAGDPSAFPGVYSMLQVLQWYRDGDRGALRNAFDGRVVLVGLTSVREVTEDIGTTPFGTTTPLIYIHANAVENCLQDTFLRPAPTWVLVLLLAALALAAGWIGSAFRFPSALATLTAILLLTAGADQALFALRGTDLPPLPLLLAPAMACAVAGVARFLFVEKRAREREEEIREGRIVQQQFLPEALVGQTLSRYRILSRVGKGGMGVVYRGEDLRLGRTVAVKVLPGGVLAEEAARRRFRREARVLSRLSHPNTARLYDFDCQDGLDFLVIEYIEGRTLAERLQDGPLPEAEILKLGCQITEALDEAHSKGIVHRDLKPANIMLTPRGDARILDFGLARLWQTSTSTLTVSTQSMTETGVTMGTVPYMAPEILLAQGADRRTDIYGVGMLLYEMATGRRPFSDDAPHELFHTILHQEPPEPRVLNRRISADLERVILKALEKEPGQRHQTSAALLEDLHALRETADRT